MEEILKFLCGQSSTGTIDRVAFWTFFLTGATAALCWIGWKQLGGIKKVSKADFIKKFSSDFFSAQARTIMILLDYDALEFKTKDVKYGKNIESRPFPFFSVNVTVYRQVFNIGTSEQVKETYSAFEIDDLLLGNIEDIGCFEKQGLIGIEGVYDSFDWYIQKVWKNVEIQKYIEHQQTSEKDGDDIYENFKYIYEKSSSFEKAKNRREWIWLWRFKWWLGIKGI